ncbi:MAG: PKD domain-containing protein, partial [Bacteroidia bacterium]|nr:PKD domain-containing protein [Bacteroidia bacterium]
MGKFFLGILKSSIAILFVFVCQIEGARASHAMGADLTYECLGGNQYRITYSFYRDCSGIPAPSTVSVNYTSSCFGGGNVLLSPDPSQPTQVLATCPTAATTCNGGSYTGIEEWIYTGIVTLPGPCADWTFDYGECCRNTAITTLDNPSSNNLYVYSLLNNLAAPCNNSPTFANNPVPFTCVGQSFCFNHGASDADGDSLVYSLITPLSSLGVPVTYDPPYSTSQPVISNPNVPLTFNPATGDICMFPIQADVTVFAVLVSEYRNGVLIGQVERDIQLTVQACTNRIPSLTGINGFPLFSKTICANTPFSFWIASIDPDAPQTTRITWDFGIPGATLTTTLSQRDTAVFNWTPTTADISTTAYCFTATVTDDNCPYLGSQVKSYCFTVCGVEANAGPDQSVACGALATLTGSAISGCGPMTYRWLPSGDVGQVYDSAGIGNYFLEVTAGAAACKDTDVVAVLPGVGSAAADFTFTTNCSGLPVQFTDQSTNANSWLWDFGDLTTSTQQNPTHTYPGNGTYNVTLTIGSAAGCTDVQTYSVVINTNVPTATFSAPGVCHGAVTSLSDISVGGPFSTWSWNFADPASGANNTSSVQNPTHTFSGPGTYPVTLTVTNTSGCSNQVQQNVVVHANPVISVPDVQICSLQQASLTGPVGYITYVWTPGGNTQTINVSPTTTSTYTLNVTDGNTCQGSDAVLVTVNPLPTAVAGPAQTICEGTSANLSGNGAGAGGAYLWTPGNLQSQNVTVSPVVTTDYTITVTDAQGCEDKDMMRVTVNPMPTVDAGNDGGICKGESTTLSIVSGSGSYLWTPGGATTSSISVSPAVTTTYTVTVSDGIGCAGIDEVTIIVNPLPVASFSSSAPACIGDPVSFTDASNIPTGTINNWSWLFGDGQFSSVQNPSAVYTSSGGFNVKLRVTSDAGCLDSLTTAININPLPIVSAGLDAGICPGFNTTLTGSGGGQYLWSPGGFTSSSITVSPA